ncbi:Glycoprotein 3-alpha-L-fucosyltransferase A [Trichinella sp. T9]|nr:Glycoprotein 3-alpha-L-fucosyltransferase A [Trichinella sp. T9]
MAMVMLTRFFACFYCLFFFILFTVIRLKVRLPVVDTLFMSTKKISNVKYEISPLTHSKLKEEIFHQITTKPKRIRPTTLVILLERSATQLDESGSKEIMASCLVNNCELTNHLDPGVVPDAVIFHDNPPILSRTKSPLNTRSFYYLNDMVNWTATYRLDSDLPNPYGLYGQIPTDLSSQIDPDLVQLLAGKTRLIAWLVSNCYTMNHREAYVHELAKHVQVDVYGTCSGRPCPWQGLSRNCSSMLRNDYKFYLAFENSNCRHYITEKLFINALQYNLFVMPFESCSYIIQHVVLYQPLASPQNKKLSFSKSLISISETMDKKNIYREITGKDHTIDDEQVVKSMIVKMQSNTLVGLQIRGLSVGSGSRCAVRIFPKDLSGRCLRFVCDSCIASRLIELSLIVVLKIGQQTSNASCRFSPI